MSKDYSCEDCENCIADEYGHSNYTVEGVNIHCIKKHNEIFDRWYGKDARLKDATSCPDFTKGGCIVIDVERACCSDMDIADTYGYTDEQKAYIREHIESCE